MSIGNEILTENASSRTLDFLPVTFHNPDRFWVLKFSDSRLVRKCSATYSLLFQVILPKNHAIYEIEISLFQSLKLYNEAINFKSKVSNFLQIYCRLLSENCFGKYFLFFELGGNYLPLLWFSQMSQMSPFCNICIFTAMFKFFRKHALLKVVKFTNSIG